MKHTELNIMLLTSNKDISYTEKFIGDFSYLNFRLHQMSTGFKNVFPGEIFKIKIEDTNSKEVWYYISGVFYDEHLNIIQPNKQSILN